MNISSWALLASSAVTAIWEEASHNAESDTGQRVYEGLGPRHVEYLMKRNHQSNAHRRHCHEKEALWHRCYTRSSFHDRGINAVAKPPQKAKNASIDPMQ